MLALARRHSASVWGGGADDELIRQREREREPPVCHRGRSAGCSTAVHLESIAPHCESSRHAKKSLQDSATVSERSLELVRARARVTSANITRSTFRHAPPPRTAISMRRKSSGW
eukprot:364013-Chlamydomonas_euryale.AAC.1